VLLPYDADAIHHAFIPDTIRKIKELEPNMDVVANFGIYVVQDIDEDVIVMIDRAQAAKNAVKGGYTDRYAFYDDRLRRREQMEKEVVSRMHRALANDEFRVFLQPWYHHVTGELVGAEALTRWEHPTRGLLLPREFIPLFEENGFISELDRYVWRQVCAMQRSWGEQGKLTVPISVNISKVDLFDPRFKERLLKVIEEESVCPAMLGIEVTESTFSDDFVHVSEVLRTVSNEGLSLFLDDFGTGYSSLNMLKDVPVDVLKLDMRFLSSTQKNSEKARSIVRSILEMCNSIGVKTVAEGVESVEQADELGEMGCHIVQGFLYSPALPVTEFEKLLRRADDPENGSST
jgi:EAL domain-containing protein (putative c-di-GMP-specific phosphodiesterase class I)